VHRSRHLLRCSDFSKQRRVLGILSSPKTCASVLRLVLESVTVNGEVRDVKTSSVSRSLKGKGKRTATLIGGGAGAGALIGGLAGGGKGALIGAAAGAGAGTAGAAYTGNKEIVLPTESILSFTLTEPITIKM
jgi:hypothetical protein